jgi:ribosomal subunit interface protein
MSARRTTTEPAQVQVTSRGDVPEAMAAYAEEKIRATYRYTTEPILSTRVVLTLSHDPARQRPAVVEASMDFDASRVRAQASASEMHAAIEMAAERLQQALVQHHDRELTRHRWLAIPRAHEWRHGTLPSPYVDHFRRPAQERQVVKHKTFGLVPMTVDEAAFDMEQMDYSFYLFVDADSGNDALVYRKDDGSLAVRGDVTPAGETAVEVTYEGAPASLDEQSAREHLDLAGEPFVFYADRDTGRGRVLYVRYDGHYGVIMAG